MSPGMISNGKRALKKYNSKYQKNGRRRKI